MFGGRDQAGYGESFDQRGQGFGLDAAELDVGAGGDVDGWVAELASSVGDGFELRAADQPAGGSDTDEHSIFCRNRVEDSGAKIFRRLHCNSPECILRDRWHELERLSGARVLSFLRTVLHDVAFAAGCGLLEALHVPVAVGREAEVEAEVELLRIVGDERDSFEIFQVGVFKDGVDQP